MSTIEFVGSSEAVIAGFPETTRQRIGYQLDRLRNGMDPSDWKPMTTIGTGVREIRIRSDRGAFRVIYVTKVGDRIYILHAFQKKTQKTRKADIDLAKERLRDTPTE